MDGSARKVVCCHDFAFVCSFIPSIKMQWSKRKTPVNFLQVTQLIILHTQSLRTR